MVAVEDLVAREASGVLEVTGSPSGAIYLDGGRIAFARASWVPGLAARLRAVCPALPPGAPAEPVGDADDAAIAGLAVQRGDLTPAALHELIASVVVDAFLVLTIPVALDSFVDAIRFTSTRTYWTDVFPRFGLEPVRGEALRRAERMAGHGLAPTTEVTLRDLRGPAAVLTREQWAVASQIGNRASGRELAARRGAALSDTMDCLGSLAQAGLCGPVRVPRRGQPRRPAVRVVPPGQYAEPSAEPFARPPAPQPPAADPAVPGPFGPGHAGPSHRAADHQFAPEHPLAVNHFPADHHPADHHPAEPFGRADRLPSRHPVQEHFARAERPVTAAQPPPVDLLRQVLNGLKKLS